MLIALYMGGKFVQGVEGAQYTKYATYGFEVNEITSFLELKQMVYEKTGVNPIQYDIDLATRINMVRGDNRPYFIRYPITDESLWRGVYNTFELRDIPVMELYFRKLPRQSRVGPSRGNTSYNNPVQRHSGFDNSGCEPPHICNSVSSRTDHA